MTAANIALDRHGILLQLPDNGPQVNAAREQYLRNVYYFKRGDLDSADSKGAAFRRQLDKAVREGALECREIAGAAMAFLPGKLS